MCWRWYGWHFYHREVITRWSLSAEQKLLVSRLLDFSKPGPARGNQGASGSFPTGLITIPPPPVWGALAVIGLSGGTRLLAWEIEEVTTKFDPRLGLELQRKLLIDRLEQLKTGIRPPDERRADGDNESGDQANQTLELEKRRALEKHLRGQVAEIEIALQKFELGTYGVCDICSQLIEPTRLEALPQANLCLSCKARQARSAR